MAMTVMAIGAAAVITMQKTSVQGNLDARKTDVANSIARMWVERLQRDAMQWTLPERRQPGAEQLRTNALIVAPGTRRPGQWFLPMQYMGATDAGDDEPGVRHPRARPAGGARSGTSRGRLLRQRPPARGFRRRCRPSPGSSAPTSASSGRAASPTRRRGLLHGRRPPRCADPDPQRPTGRSTPSSTPST